MTPLNARRLRIFRSNRRARYSLWLFGLILLLTLVSELLANHKPLLIRYQDHWYVPVVQTYSEQQFGGDFATEADYRDPFVQQLINAQGFMLWPPIRFSYDSINTGLKVPVPSPPSAENWLGTDDQGRDVLARLLYGLRLSLVFGLSLTLLSSLIGVLVGAVQGYFGGWVDLLGQRLIEVWSGLPLLYLLIILSSLFTPGFWWLLLLMLMFSWMTLVGVVRAEFLKARNLEYVRAAKALGVGDARIMWRHLLPNAMVATLSMLPFILTSSITALTSLDFLGFGMPVGSASLGELLRQAKENLQAPWLALTAFGSLALVLTLLVFIGEGVRDAFDPRKQEVE